MTNLPQKNQWKLFKTKVKKENVEKAGNQIINEQKEKRKQRQIMEKEVEVDNGKGSRGR